MKIKLNRGQLAVLTVLLVAAAVAIGFIYRSKSTAAEEYITAKVDKGNIRNTVSATGTLQAVTTVQVGSQVSGVISALYVDFNSTVKKGQLIAQLDPSILRAQVASARANLDQATAGLADAQAKVLSAKAAVSNLHAGVSSAAANLAALKAQLDDAKSLLDRQIALAETGIVPQRDLESSQTAYASARARYDQASAQLDQARMSEQTSAGAGLAQAQAQVQQSQAQVRQTQAALQLAEVNLSHTTIRSPIDGVVVSRNVDVGQTVAASLSAPTLFTIANDLTAMQVIANIDQADIGVINESNRVRFSVDAFPGKNFHGTLKQVRLNPQNVQNVVTYNVIIDVRNPDLQLKPGMTANLIMTIAERNDVIKIPNSALRFRPQGQSVERSRDAAGAGQSGAGTDANSNRRAGSSSEPVGDAQARTVWVLGANKKIEPRRIKIGITDGSMTEVIEGALTQGETVVIGQNISSSATSTQTNPLQTNAPGMRGVGGGGRR